MLFGKIIISKEEVIYPSVHLELGLSRDLGKIVMTLGELYHGRAGEY